MIRKQVASEGKYLYRLVDNQYIISSEIYLGKNDTEWEECDEVQKAKFEAHNAAVLSELEKDLNK